MPSLLRLDLHGVQITVKVLKGADVMFSVTVLVQMFTSVSLVPF